MTAYSLSSGRMTAGVADAYKTPRVLRPVRPVVYCHGAGGSAGELNGAGGLVAVGTLTQAVASIGFPIVCAEMPQTWGNATSQARLSAAVIYARTSLGAHPDLAPLIIAVSHGAACAYNWARNNPVAAIANIIPCLDLQFTRVNNTLGTLRASIDAAFGVTYPAALPAGSDPYADRASFTEIPAQFWYANDDDVSHNVPVFSAAVGGELHDVGATGHSNTSIAAATPSAVIGFLMAHI